MGEGAEGNSTCLFAGLAVAGCTTWVPERTDTCCWAVAEGRRGRSRWGCVHFLLGALRGRPGCACRPAPAGSPEVLGMAWFVGVSRPRLPSPSHDVPHGARPSPNPLFYGGVRPKGLGVHATAGDLIFTDLMSLQRLDVLISHTYRCHGLNLHVSYRRDTIQHTIVCLRFSETSELLKFSQWHC